MKARDVMSKGIMHLMRKSPFYSTIIVKQQVIEDENLNAPMATDGKRLLYNPLQIKSLNNKTIYEILKHEAMHITNKHHIRMKVLEKKYNDVVKNLNIDFHKAFNVAADLAINSLLVHVDHENVWDEGILSKGCVPGKVPFEDYPIEQSCEFYMKRLIDNVKEQDKSEQEDKAKELGIHKDCSNNSCGEILGAEGDLTQAEAEANAQIAAAIVMANGSNADESKHVKAMLTKMKSIKLNWRNELDKFIMKTTNGSPNYRRPNRRYTSSEFIMPSNKHKSVDNIMLLVDVSGSMSDEAVTSVYDHITNIIKYSKNTTVTMLPFDHEVFVNDMKVFNKSNIPVKDKDRDRISYGGTKFTDPTIFALSKRPSGIIMLTDLLPYDLEDFNELKISTPFLMLSVLKASNWYSDNEVDRIRSQYKNKRIIEVDI